MALHIIQSISGIVIAAYLLTFLLFAILRIFTGISIQRLGFSSLRHIAYSPRDGIKIEIRGLGIQVHRPTFAQPTWFSIVVEDLKVIVDLRVLGAGQAKQANAEVKGAVESYAKTTPALPPSSTHEASEESGKGRGKFWSKLVQIKNDFKRLHNIIPWLRLVDILARRSTCVVADVGSLQIGTLLLGVDTRRATVDRSRLFQHSKVHEGEQWPAEWSLTVQNILFTPEEKEVIEIIDHVILNVHGYLRPEKEGLRDATVSLKIGRIHLPCDEFDLARDKLRKADRDRQGLATPTSPLRSRPTSDYGFAEKEDDQNTFPKVLSEARDFVASSLRGIREVSLAVGFVGASKSIDSIKSAKGALYLNASLKEIGMDLYRLDSSTPEHSMFFARHEVAHQALITALSASLGLDAGHDHPERLIYIPMTTATIRTTLPSKLVQFSIEGTSLDLNSNVLFANLVITSPSIDLDPAHLPIVLAALRSKGRSSARSQEAGNRNFASKLLPRAIVKISVHEPVLRVALPPVETRKVGEFDFDLLISAVSSVSMDFDSAHNSASDSRYNATLNLRIASHRLYYQTTSRETHDLLVSESMSLKTQITSDPQVLVVANLNMQTFSLYMVRPEIIEAIRQIVHQLRSNVKDDKLRRPKSSRDPNMLRALPPWLHHIDLQASDLNCEVSGVDQKLSTMSRGLALHLDSFTTEYKVHKDDEARRPPHRRRGGSQSFRAEGDASRPQSPTSKSRPRITGSPTDGRRVAVHFKGLESHIIESTTHYESEPFIFLPQAEVALTTSHDGQGSILHVNTYITSLYLQYSLFRHYAISVAIFTLHKALSRSRSLASNVSGGHTQTKPAERSQEVESSYHDEEYVSADLRVNFLQVKAQLPEDPHVMLQMSGLEAARRRWNTPFFRSRAARLFAESPGIKGTWSRLVSMKSPRVDFRSGRRKQGTAVILEKSLDVTSDAARIDVPSQLVVHKIFDNFVNTAKTVQQLQHRFKTGSDEYILRKFPEGPKDVPRVTFRTQTFLFAIEDAPFEWKLGAIFRTGLVEQKQRLAREEAFHIKCKTVQNSFKQGSSHVRSDSQHSPGRGRTDSQNRDQNDQSARPKSARERQRSVTQSAHRGRSMRYDKEGTHKISGYSQTSSQEAYVRLQKYNAQSWKKRIDQASKRQRGTLDEIRDMIWGSEEFPEDSERSETLLQIPHRPALASVMMTDLTITIDKPTFPREELPRFLHSVGKGLPLHTQFSLLIPLHAQFDVGELRASLRDYPLPVLHIPSLRPGQSPKLPGFSLKTDFVIAEEFRDFESTRDLPIIVIPAEKMTEDKNKAGAFVVDVRRTVSPVKTYSDIKLEVHTARDTRITWGASYQPAIQDTMQVIEGFTKPQVDPSERVGFWDKIRLSFHSRINWAWVGGGDVHLTLKGSRDPYNVTSHGAGFMLIWRNHVRLNIRQEDDPTKFMTVESGDFVLAIPDFSKQARKPLELLASQVRGDRSHDPDDLQTFKKVVMKLSGKVCWTAGLVFERNAEEGRRSFDFAPHYDVTLKNPTHVKALRKKPSYDAFRGFRSNFIHMSVGVAAPSDREWTVSNLKPSSNYNTVHLTPRFFTHFFAWWDMFSGTMSLPVHQGPLFPGTEKSGKKFGRHLATVKYSLLMAPLFLSHVYLHKDGDEFTNDVVSATGLKIRLDSFVVDIHQRREEFMSEIKGHQNKVATTGMRINQALVDLVKADLRAVSVGIGGTSLETVKKATQEQLQALQQMQGPIALEGFHIPDSDYSWVDVDDFVELDWTLPYSNTPKTSILPLGSSPRFTYRRQTDHGDTISGDKNRHSPFGNETTHNCIMSIANDSRQVQLQLIEERLAQIEELMKDHTRAVGDQELHVVREVDNVEARQDQLNELLEHGDIFERKQAFLASMAEDLRRRIAHEQGHSNWGFGETSSDGQIRQFENRAERNPTADEAKAATDTNHISDFNNRFIVHNAQIKWSNALRNILLRYVHQVSQRRGFVYYTSRRAVKFILDIIEEQKRTNAHKRSQTEQSGDNTPETPMDDMNDENVQARINELLRDGKDFVNADDPESNEGNRKSASATHETNEDVSKDFVAQNVYHVRLVAPQIQLQSEKNTKSVVLVAARGMRLQVFQIMDKDRVSDEISGLVQTRYALDMDNLQFFVTSKQSFSPHFLPLYSGNSYGTATGSQWPPWAPMEAMFDFEAKSYGFERVVERTSATLRYDKYNKLRLKYNDSVTDGKGVPLDSSDDPDSRMDQFSVDFPQLRARCDSDQYYAMYIIVLDLLMWSEPLEKQRDERLEKIMLAADFSDLRGAPEMVMTLQDRIRALQEIKTHFHVNEKFLDRQGLQDRIEMERDLATCEDELFFIMKAITTSQRKVDERADSASGNGVLKYFISAAEIVWHLSRDGGHALAEFQLKHTNFQRTDNSDGSNQTAVDIDQVRGLSLLENAMYPEIISSFMEHGGNKPPEGHSQMLHVKWLQLEAIGGIKVVDHFEVDLHPIKIQLDYETGRKLFEYVFPGAGSGDEGFSPFMVRNKLPQTEEEDEDEEERNAAQAQHEAIVNATKDQPAGSATGAGSLEHRLQPTRALPDYNRSGPKAKGLGISLGEPHRPKYLQRFTGASDRTITTSSNLPKTLKARTSADNLSLGARSARGRQQSYTPSIASNAETPHQPHKKRFQVGTKTRSASADSRKSKNDLDKRSDDLSQMLSRASNYMTLSYFKIPSVVLCLSYKGKGQRNMTDVHNLVFRMPTLEYRNKTWSNLDLAVALKKDVIRALISHTGAIVSNKFSNHKYGKSQQSRLRELASSSVILSSGEGSRVPSAASSVKHFALGATDASSSSRPSVDSGSDLASGADIVRTDTLDYDSHSLDRPYTPSEQEEKEIPESQGRRTAFTRQFSELTQKAANFRSKHSEETNGAPNGHGTETSASRKNSVGESETTPRRTRLVKKIMTKLEKDRDKS